MRLGFVTQWFPPEPTEVSWNMATALRDRGHEVHVLTGWPHYPSGKLPKGYPRALYRREQMDGITIHRTAEIPGHSQSVLSRLANYASFAATATLATAIMPRMDVWLIYHSPATAAIPGLIAARLSRLSRRPAAIAQVIQDLWPESVIDSDFLRPGILLSLITKALESFCRTSYRQSQAIGVISPGMRQILIDRGVTGDKILDTPNWTLTNLESSICGKRSDLGLPEGRLLLYAGNLGDLQNLTRLTEMCAQVPDLQLVFMGNGVVRQELESMAAQFPNVHVKNPVPAKAIGKYLASADGLVISLKDTPVLRATMPSKVQSSLAAGRPLVAHLAGDVADLVRRSSSGIVIDPYDCSNAVDSLQEFATVSIEQLEVWGANARRTFEEEYSPVIGGRQLERLVLHAVHTLPAGPSRKNNANGIVDQ